MHKRLAMGEKLDGKSLAPKGETPVKSGTPDKNK
jgi:hypothetical protein